MELLLFMKIRRFFITISALCLLSSVGHSALADGEIHDISGYVTISNGEYFITEGTRQTRLAPLTAAVKSALLKLKTHDFISGTIEVVGKSYILHTVDSVGLRRLLGLWQSGGTVIEFSNFHAMKFLTQDTVEYMYTLTPDVGANWKVFLTDQSSVTLGALRTNSIAKPDEMILELYDSASGSIIKRINLKKVKK